MFTTRLIALLLKEREKSLYTYPGGTIAPVFHECQESKVGIVCAKSEQGAGYMAVADALTTGTPSFVAVTSGPGATNLITCIADAFYDSVPLIAFTGQVGTQDLSRSSLLRQRGFQEVPIVEVVTKITKAAFQPKTPQDLVDALIAACRISLEGRPGPVLIDLPMDVQMSPLSSDLLSSFTRQLKTEQTVAPPSPIDSNIMDDMLGSIGAAKRPLILAGGGCISGQKELTHFVRRSGIPVVTSMRGIGCFDTSHALSAGWIGHTGLPWANWALSQSDWVLVLGSRLDIRQTGTVLDQFARKKIFQVDIDIQELTHGRLPNVHAVHGQVETVLKFLSGKMDFNALNFKGWTDAIAAQKKLRTIQDSGNAPGVAPDELLPLIDRMTRGMPTSVVTGVGSHQQWVARHLTFNLPGKRLYTSAGHGTMGYALPVALGIKRIQPDRLVLSVDGDGSFQMNIQELALIRELDIPLKILIMDNRRLGIVSQFQKITFSDDPVTGSFRSPNFIRIAEAYGLKTWDLPEMDRSVVAAWLNEPGPALLRAHIQKDAPVSPMLLGGQTLDAMWYAEGGE